MEILGEGWNSRLGVILAVAGSAVGLGNFLRFPGQAVANGGGAFMIPYLCALLLLGIPICWAEWTMGRYGGARGFHSSPAIMGVVGRGAVPRYFGVLGLLIPLVIFMYYGLVESWCLRYAWAYASGAMDLGSDVSAYTGASQAFFSEISGSSQHGVIVDGHLDAAVVFWAVAFVINLWLVYRGLSRGIETFCRWAMPAMAVCAVVVLIRVLTLGTPNPRGEVGLVAGDDREPMPKGGRGDQAIDGGHRFLQAGHQPAPFVRDACIDRQNTVFEPGGQLRFKPRGYPRAAATAPELLDSLADFAQGQDANEQRLRWRRVEPFGYAGRRPRLEQFGKRAGINQKAHSSISRGGDWSRSMFSWTPASGEVRRNSPNEGFDRLRRS